MEYGIFISGLCVGSAKRKEKDKIINGSILKEFDGYDLSIGDGCGKFWKIKVQDDPQAVCQFGDPVRVRIDRITAYRDNVYFSGEVVPELPC